MDSLEIHLSPLRLFNFLATLLFGIYFFCCSPALFLPLFIAPAFSSHHHFIQPKDNCTPHSLVDTCGNAHLQIQFPFWRKDWPGNCAYDKEYEISCNPTENSYDIEIQSSKFHIKDIDYHHYFHSHAIIAEKQVFKEKNDSCVLPARNGTTLNTGPFDYSNEQNVNITLFYNCSCPPPSDDKNEPGTSFISLQCLSNEEAGRHAYFVVPPIPANRELGKGCEKMEILIQETKLELLVDKPEVSWNLVLAEGFVVSWANIYQYCKEKCHKSKGDCIPNRTSPQNPSCFCRDEPTRLYIDACPPGKNSSKKKYIAGFAGGGGGAIAFIICCFCKKLHISTSFKPLTHSISYDPSLNSDIENIGFLHGTQFFHYKELKEATNNFDSSKELGHGGFGIVYHGQLSDGRNVAVKRLYECNFRRIEQFKNEIKILSQFRHSNLVMLYGCSFRHNHELLLVYEFIPNGTLGDHLHGNRAKLGALGWLTRMSIAIETADALKYLHAVDIIHRDIKTNNILLDNNFHVKVADFGLSRLFPTNATHVSTVPQGTLGYVDPDYHRCYQLTEKSDVYSFGVVLIELISSQPAVDTDRHHDEINLANLAIKKIHNSALKELVDSNIGFDSDPHINKMIICVSELAFRCLQDEKDIRPSMEEVLETLKGIGEQGEEYLVQKVEEEITQQNGGVLLKKMSSSSSAITDTWESTYTTPNTSN